MTPTRDRHGRNDPDPRAAHLSLVPAASPTRETRDGTTEDGTTREGAQRRSGRARVRRDPSAYDEPDPVLTAASIWVTGQQDAKTQRRGRYVPATVGHPAKMLPAIARHAITHYTRPGEVVLDPMCGIGTSLIEAVRAGRHALGVEYEPRWTAITRANLALARADHAPGHGRVVCADARDLPRVIHPALAGLLGHVDDPADPTTPGRWQRPVSLILTSPPYGEYTHGQAKTIPGVGVAKHHHRYAQTRRGSRNLAHADLDELLAGFTTILTRAVTLLRPGGHVVLTTRPYRRAGELVDLPTAVVATAEAAGLTLIERTPALIAGLRDDHLVPRASFFQLLAVRQARATGIPQHVIQHEDVLAFRLPPNHSSFRELGCPSGDLGCRHRSSCDVTVPASVEPVRAA